MRKELKSRGQAYSSLVVMAGNALPVFGWGPLWAETPSEELVLSEVCERGALHFLSCPTCAAAVVTK